MAETTNVFELEARRLQRAAGDTDPFGARQDIEKRRAHLARAEPAITDDDIDALAFDQLTLRTEHLQAVQAWLTTRIPLLFLSGTVGVGKSVAAAYAIARHGGSYIRAEDMDAVFSGKDQASKARRRELLGALILVVDDLGDEDDAALGLKHFKTIVDTRRSRGRRTIFTTNLDAPRLIARYAEARLWDRVNQSRVFKPYAGPSLRKAHSQ